LSFANSTKEFVQDISLPPLSTGSRCGDYLTSARTKKRIKETLCLILALSSFAQLLFSLLINFLKPFGPSPPQSRSSGVTQGGRSHRGPVGLSGQGCNFLNLKIGEFETLQFEP